MHETLKVENEIVPDWEPVADGRMLAATYGGIRIVADFSTLSATAAVTAYLKNKLLPDAISYFAQTLQVPQLSSLKIPAGAACGLSVPSKYQAGIQGADLILFVTGESSSESWIAWAKSCKLLASTGRPFVGQINFNYQDLGAANANEFQADLIASMHEMTHVLGFSDSLYNHYVTPVTVQSNGVNNYIDVEPLTTRLRNYFNCPSLEGGYLENQGGSGSAGAHWERRTFGNEYMTASSISDARISQFTLALLEGSGWYKVNYDMADAYFWGKGEGCGFMSSTSSKYKEFCSGSADGCTFHGAAGGYCATDSFGDSAEYIRSYTNSECSDSANSKSATIGGEHYGDSSKCFMGTLYGSGALSTARPYCFSYSCVDQGNGNFELDVKVGNAAAKCTAAGKIRVSGYSGTLNCPDPQKYCTTIGAPYCKRGCMGSGTCVNAQCQCNAGWSGLDCSIKGASTNSQASATPVAAANDNQAAAVDNQDVVPTKKTKKKKKHQNVGNGEDFNGF